jgi:hypothetical protein
MNLRWKDVPARLRGAVERYVEAKIADSWKGGGDPEDWPAIEECLRRRRAALVKIIAEYIPPAHGRPLRRGV